MRQAHWVSSRGCVYNVYYHLVWSTKYRRKVLTGRIEEFLRDLHKAIADEHGFILLAQEIMPDHVHLFISAHPKIAPANIVKIMKGVTARKLFVMFPELKRKLWKGHLWNPSYYLGTAGDVSKDTIKRYIELQKGGELNAND
ncbi:MAG: IS200/IS605 family transposase [Desulfomonilaceae bacterium]